MEMRLPARRILLTLKILILKVALPLKVFYCSLTTTFIINEI